MAEDFSVHRALGRTGLLVSRLGLASGYGIGSEAVERAFHEYGVNYFLCGTRRGGGMRQALRTLAPVHREKIVIAVQTYDHLGFFMKRSVERGLRSHGIDRFDVLVLGWFNHFPGRRVLDAALRLRDEGKVRHLAMSGHNRSLFGSVAREGCSPIDIFMVRYNAAHRGAEKEVFPFLPEKEPPGVTTYTATRWGKLLRAGKMPAGERPLTAAECYRFVLSHPGVDLCLAGPRTDDEMVEGMEALRGGPLTPDEMERARRIGDHVHGRR